LKVGPFAGLPFPNASARANAIHVLREHISTYLITHPHLDHFSAFVINTAGLQHGRKAKCLAGLPFTVNAIKQHIFNDIIWPNLTDEDNGVGFVTFQRLTEGGNLALGEGESRGYIDVCDGLSVRAFKISHGTCASNPPMLLDPAGRRGSLPGIQDPSWHLAKTAASQQSEGMRRTSIFSGSSQPTTPTMYSQGGNNALVTSDGRTIVDSTAFFIRADPSGREILVFGDVEPDSLSAIPRTYLVWQEAALKIALGTLTAVFIECSYPDSQGDSMLFGHLVPRHLIAELCVLADLVTSQRRDSGTLGDRKRKRQSMGISGPSAASPEASTPKQRRTVFRPLSLKEVGENPVAAELSPGAPDSNIGKMLLDSPAGLPLAGLTVVVIHVKDDMRDGPWVGDIILQELKGHEAQLSSQGKALGCEFTVSKSGESYYL
jgi:cAMP phosphodiesterase